MQIKFALTAALIAGSLPAFAADQIGVALFTAGDAKVVSLDGTERSLKQGDPILQGDRVQTSGKAVAQIKLDDGSRLGVRPGSDLKIEKKPDISPGVGGILSLKEGTVRVINADTTAKSAQPLLLRTPTSTVQLTKSDIQSTFIGGGKSDGGSFHKVNTGNAMLIAERGNTPLKNHTVEAINQNGQAPVVVDSLPKGVPDFSPGKLPELDIAQDKRPVSLAVVTPIRPVVNTPVLRPNNPPPITPSVRLGPVKPPELLITATEVTRLQNSGVQLNTRNVSVKSGVSLVRFQPATR